MKRTALIILMLCLAVGCTSADTASHTQITVNYPTDNSVNGYRTGSYTVSDASSLPDTVPIEETRPASPSEADKTVTAEFIGNSSSHIFHKSSCSSAEKLKESNRVSFSNREKAVNDGYKPCKRCNP